MELQRRTLLPEQLKVKTMKNIVAASAILALFAGIASAASVQSPERPSVAPAAVTAQNVKQVTAKTLYSPKELVRSDLNANDLVEVTVFPSTGTVDERGGDN